MSNINLPSEICCKIFEQLERSDVYECITVCKDWHKPAIQTYYEVLRLSGEKLIFLRQKLQVDKENQDQKLDNGYWTKELMFDSDYEEKYRLESAEFFLLLSYVPKLKSIDFSSSIQFDYYMDLLYNAAKYLNHVEIIYPQKLPKDNDHTQYFSTCHSFCKTLTRLELDHGLLSTSTYSTDGLFYALSHFNNLTTLSIKRVMDKSFTFFLILYNLPNLTKLTYALSSSAVGNTEQETTVLMDPATLTTNSKKLKSLHLNIPSLTAPYVDYITSCTSRALDDVVIRVRNGIYKWIDESDIDDVSKFANSLSLIKDVYISSRQERKPPPNVRPNQMTVYYSFINALKGSRNIRCDVSVEEYKCPYISISVIDNKRMYIKHRLSVEDYYPICDEGAVNIGGDIVQSLKVTAEDSSSDIEGILTYGLKNFNNLTRLEINDIDYMYSGLVSSKIIVTSNEQDRRADNTKKKREEVLTSIYLTENSPLWPDITDTLCSYLPNIKVISCVDCNYWHTLRVSPWCNQLELDLTMFKQLNVFKLDVDRLVRLDVDYMFFKIIYPDFNNEEILYQLKVDYVGANEVYEFTPTTTDFINKHHGKEASKTTIEISALTTIKCNNKTKIFIRDYYHKIIGEV